MFYVINKEDKLSIFDDNKEKIEKTREFMPQLDGQYILETDIVTAEELHEHPNKVIVDDIEIEIEVPDFETVDIEVEIHDVDEEGNYIYDEEGNPVTHKETRPVQQQVGSHTETITVKGLVLNPDYEDEEAAKERERLNKLSLTKREVFLALYKDKGITPDYIKNEILKQVQDDSQNEALIEFEYANDYFRGNPLIGQIGAMLGYTSDDLDYLFEHKELLTNE